MRKALSLILIVIFLAGLTGSMRAQATSEPPATPAATTPTTTAASTPAATSTDTPATPQNCDFATVKQSIYSTESATAGGYTAVGRTMTNQGRALGKYQFMPPTLESMLNQNPSCNGSACHGQAILNRECWPVQECVMDRFLAGNLARVRRDPACQALMGQTVTGSGQGQTLTCQVTESGLLGAMHLGGQTVCRRMQRNINSPGLSDAGGTSAPYYTCKHGGLSVPGNCAAANAPVDLNVPTPTLTATQVETQTAEQGYIMPSTDPVNYFWTAALMMMAEQFTATMTAQVQAVGMMFDAKHQLETQRLFQQRAAEAHKDYQPSEQMCTFGTLARDLAATDRSSNLTKIAVSQEIMQRELGSGESKGATSVSDSLSRIGQFRKKFCNVGDNGGLGLLCPDPVPAEMQDRDIDYTRSLDQPLSLEINLTDDTVTNDEEAVFALVDNLFAHDPAPRLPKTALGKRSYQYHYLNLRSITAMRGIARNSFANIIALKTATPSTGNDTSAPYLRALLREFGLSDAEIMKLVGENPSYYAQMEILTKKIYQNPTFYTNLYDKPTNVERIRAAMRAIKLMQDRDIQASLMRREMLLSMMLELRLREKAKDIYSNAEDAMFN